ncbi:hypothetical protein OHB24_13710 [Kribbella sp. NBC_00482]|uniref:hypothetical protein n=1 Tax=Kribbella sp. NBC_00482 TaxID=2975968 RepID=UPI002E17F9C5
MDDRRDKGERILRILVGEGRLEEAVEYAQEKVRAGEQWATAWVPAIRPADRDQVSAIQYFLTKRADEALPDLLANEQGGRTKLWMADTDWAAYGDLRVRRTEPGRAEIALACWHVYTDFARYVGNNPPNDAETELAPEGTAVVDLALTVGVVNDLAARYDAAGVPRPLGNGSHLAVVVPLPAS